MAPERSFAKGKRPVVIIRGGNGKVVKTEVIQKPPPSDLKTKTDRKWHETRRGK